MKTEHILLGYVIKLLWSKRDSYRRLTMSP
jgi:hypothetical protein